MNRKNWIVLVLGVLLVHLCAIALEIRLLEYATKPLLLISIGWYFVIQTRDFPSPFRKWILAALFFSWLGDVLLMFQARKPVFFLLGLSAFLIAHLFYIVFFHQLRVREQVRARPVILVIVAAYYAGLIILLSPYLGELRLPVRVYGLVISCMLMLAAHAWFARERTAGRLMTIGALFFVISDSTLAINKFYHPFAAAGIVIMLTYGLAQILIVEGACRYLRSTDKR
jgi:uncharacterized membrane protein YhhN